MEHAPIYEYANARSFRSKMVISILQTVHIGSLHKIPRPTSYNFEKILLNVFCFLQLLCSPVKYFNKPARAAFIAVFQNLGISFDSL